ncbi:Ppx/GppA family phosphatase [Micromonospora sp. CPCC 205371]|nr:Ppx/GppA family phosphatase [Micromonospora sp. CPCC 205371]
MRIGVLDVGSNTAHLLIADGGVGVPLPLHAIKTRLRLAEHVDAEGALGAPAIDRLGDAVADAVAKARAWQVQELYAYGTAVVRDAPNQQEILSAVWNRSGVRLGLLTGREEAELTFLAARRWMGWRSGPLLVLDIGGGSLEIAYGHDVSPQFAVSLPVGAGRLTRERLRGDPPSRAKIKALRGHVRDQLAEAATRMHWEGTGTTTATSRTFHQLARLCGAPPKRLGPFVPRHLRRGELEKQLKRLARMRAAERAKLPGISAPRARQSLAGAIVAHTTMTAFGLDEVTLCPWALREGILLRSPDPGAWWADHPPRLAVPDIRPPAPDVGADADVVPLGRARTSRRS